MSKDKSQSASTLFASTNCLRQEYLISNQAQLFSEELEAIFGIVVRYTAAGSQDFHLHNTRINRRTNNRRVAAEAAMQISQFRPSGSSAAAGLAQKYHGILGVVADPNDKRVPEVARACLAPIGSQLLALPGADLAVGSDGPGLYRVQRDEQAPSFIPGSARWRQR